MQARANPAALFALGVGYSRLYLIELIELIEVIYRLDRAELLDLIRLIA